MSEDLLRLLHKWRCQRQRRQALHERKEELGREILRADREVLELEKALRRHPDLADGVYRVDVDAAVKVETVRYLGRPRVMLEMVEVDDE